MADSDITVIVSGPALSGKSVILVEIAEALTARGINVQVDLDGAIGFEERDLLKSKEERDRRLSLLPTEAMITIMEQQTPRAAFDKIKDGIGDAIAYANGNTAGSVAHTRGH